MFTRSRRNLAICASVVLALTVALSTIPAKIANAENGPRDVAHDVDGPDADFDFAAGEAGLQIDETASSEADAVSTLKGEAAVGIRATADASSDAPDSSIVWPTEIFVTDCGNNRISVAQLGQCVRFWITVYNATPYRRTVRATILSYNPNTGQYFVVDDDYIDPTPGTSRWFSQVTTSSTTMPGPRQLTTTVDGSSAYGSITIGGGSGGPFSCPGQQVFPGQTTIGQIVDWDPSDTLCVVNNMGPGTYRISMSAMNGNLDTFLRVFSAWGGLVAENDDIGPNNLNSQVYIYTTGSDTPFLRIDASRYAGQGSYALTVDFWR